MKIKIKDQEIELIYCQKIYLKFEDLYHRTLTMDQLSSYSCIADLIYCAIISSIEHHSQRDKYVGFTLTREDFDDWYDDDATIITHDFTQWFMKCVQEQMDKLQKHIQEQEEQEKQDKKSKKVDPKK